MAKHGCCADKACNDRTCMELPAGTTCGDCKHFRHCAAFYAHKATDTYCDFYPRRFAQRVTDGVAPCAPREITPEMMTEAAKRVGFDPVPGKLIILAGALNAMLAAGVKEVPRG